jgi:arylsulfatase A-like enzyme
VDTPVEVVDLAPTFAALLGVEVPSGNEGKPLPLPLSLLTGPR